MAISDEVVTFSNGRRVEVVIFPDNPPAGNPAPMPPPYRLYQPGARTVLDGSGDSNGTTREAIVDAVAYPVLTEPISYPVAPATAPSAAPPGGGTAPLGQIVEGAIRDVLGWRPKANDPTSFTAALNQAFDLKQVEGHTEWTWTPKSYAVQTDLGAVTGAQASIYTRAKVALDQALPLLDGLTALRADVLPEDLESMRAVVRSELTQLVNEFGLLGGPRVQRVDQLFFLLLGGTLTATGVVLNSANPEQVQGELGMLGDRFGMERSRVNTIDDEQDLTNYLILVDYVIGLNQSWVSSDRQYFASVPNDPGAPQPFLGTQLVLLSRALEVVAESVHNVYFTMDSVFLGPAERQTIQLNLVDTSTTPPQPQPPLYMADLLEWVDRVVSQEGPRLIQDGGKDGVAALTPILAQLGTLVCASLLNPVPACNPGVLRLQDPAVLPPGYATPRVQRALQTLFDEINEAYTLASELQPPALGDVEYDLQKWAAQYKGKSKDLVPALKDLITLLQSPSV